jgi:ribosomal protein L10
MKTKEKKQKELNAAKELLKQSEGIFLIDVLNLPTKFLNKLREELKQKSSKLLIIKKRIFNLGLKENKFNLDLLNIKKSFGIIFASNLEEIIQAVYKFLKEIEKEKVIASADEKILNGFNIKLNKNIQKEEIIFIGKLPPREVALGQLMGMISTPLRSLMYILQEKAKRS